MKCGNTRLYNNVNASPTSLLVVPQIHHKHGSILFEHLVKFIKFGQIAQYPFKPPSFYVTDSNLLLKLLYKLVVMLSGTGAIATCTACLNWSKHGQPCWFTFCGTRAHTFSMMFWSWLLGGQFGSNCTLEPWCAFHSLTTCSATPWVGSLSCCTFHVLMLCIVNNLVPSGSTVLCSTSLYSTDVMFLAHLPNLVLNDVACLLVHATTCMTVIPYGLMLAYTFTYCGFVGLNTPSLSFSLLKHPIGRLHPWS